MQKTKRTRMTPRGGICVYALRGEAVKQFLDGRPRDHRVLYATSVNLGKTYPYSSKRQTRDGRSPRNAGVTE